MRSHKFIRCLAVAGAVAMTVSALAGSPAASAPPTELAPSDKAAGYWSEARRDSAQPRDLVIDERGLAYLRAADGSLRPHGHSAPAEPSSLRSVPTAKPTSPPGGGGGGGADDTTAPSIDGLVPSQGATVGSQAQFSAIVTDASGVRSVTVHLVGGGSTWSFAASSLGGDQWGVTLQGLTDGAWSWSVTATDAAKKGGNTASSGSVGFTVATTPIEPVGDVVSNSAWTTDDAVKKSAGRIYFEMPANKGKSRWSGYVCSGTVVTESVTERSVILTAAHCVYDDVTKTFARNVLFIPDQASTTSAGTDTDCSNDRFGCWAPSFGVVDDDWTTRTFPDNIPWDYAFYVVSDNGAHSGSDASSALDGAVGSLPVSFASPTTGVLTHALGYSYSEDPKFMYCAEPVTGLDAANWWLASCGLSGGASGGPWIQPMTVADGSGPIISVNSWGYRDTPGMAGPKLSGTSAACLFNIATSEPLNTVGGVAPLCPVP